MLDLGTGARYFAKHIGCVSGRFNGTALLTHLHWDHVQGLPFFSPLLNPDTVLNIVAPDQGRGEELRDVMSGMIRPPMFPVSLDGFPGTINVRAVTDETFAVGGFTVTSRLVPHIGQTLGFRVEHGGRSIAYIPDHQQPVDGSMTIDDAIVDLVSGVDVLIHDSQYTSHEFAKDRAIWGHSTPEYSMHIAAECAVKTLVLFHHDPLRDDDQLDLFKTRFTSDRFETIVANEGLTLSI